MNGPLEEQMGEKMVSDKVHLSVVCTSRLLSCNKNQSSLTDGIPGERSDDSWVLWGALSLGRQTRGVQR